MFFNRLPTASKIKPQFSLGGLLDIPTGNYLTGKNGESILSSGLSSINSIIGPQNSFKTALTMYVFLTVLSRYKGSFMGVYDTEGSFTYERLKSILENFARLKHIDLDDPTSAEIIQLVSSGDILGDKWFEEIKKSLDERKKVEDKLLKTTPFKDFGDKNLKMMPPVMLVVDSLSQFKISSVEGKIVDKNAVGESGANTQFMKEGAAKAQLITQLPNMTTKNNMLFGMVAHTGNKIEMDQYAPKAAKLAHSRKGATVKGATEKFEFINNNLFEIFDAKPLINSSSDRTAKYPFGESDRQEGTIDLMLVRMVNTRNKNGPSGFQFNLIVSQTRGFQPTLTEFHYLKETADRFGISGNNVSYEMDIYPGVKLGRTTVAHKVLEDARLARAIEITAQMAQMQRHWNLDEKYICSPKDLYDDLKSKGYDWDVLLNTRGWWCFEEDAPLELPYLSTMDLLKMRTGEYHPFWLPAQKGKE